MREVAILGVGVHRFGRFPDKSVQEMGQVAIANALDHAGVSWKDIEAVYAGAVSPPAAGQPGNQLTAAMGATGVPVVNIETACSTGGTCLFSAYHVVAGGFYDTVLVVGVEKMPSGPLAGAGDPSVRYFERLMGTSVPGLAFALLAARQMKEGRATLQQLARISVRSHKNASLTPYAHYQNYPNLTIEDVLTSRMVLDPLTMLMLCPFDEGAAGVVICAKEVALKRFSAKKPVTIAAVVTTSGTYDRYNIILNQGQEKRTAKLAYEMASLGPKDIDLAQLEDEAPSGEVEAAEGLGLCAPGEYPSLVMNGETDLGGRLPVNTDGGYLSRGNAPGAATLASIAETVWQLRGEAGPRQVKEGKAKVGLVQGLGAGPNCAMAIIKR